MTRTTSTTSRGRRLAAVTMTLAAALVAATAAVVPAQAADPLPEPVSTNSADRIPELVASGAIAQPHVDALARIGDTVYAGGLFDTVAQGGTTYARNNLMAYDRTTGAVSQTFLPELAGGQVWGLEADPATDALYVGGEFRTVDGVARPAVVKLDGTTGRLDPTFAPKLTGGRINDLELVTVGGVSHLVIGGTPSRKLLSLNPVTGLDDRWIQLPVTGQLPGSWGNTPMVHQIAVDPSGTRLAMTGNFQQVGGLDRVKFALLDLAPGGASVASWYYPGFAKPCATSSPRRIANLQGVDFSPDGTAVTVTATGQIPLSKADIWYHRLGDANNPDTTVCDAVGRFSLADDTKPQWINYTGGDSVWNGVDTGSAIYVSGHFQYFDNPDGYASKPIGDKTSLAPAVRRVGIAALDPVTGLAMPWRSDIRSVRIGGKALLVDEAGLHVGHDGLGIGKDTRLGLAYLPLPRPASVVWAVGQACDDTGSAACAEVGRLIAADTEADAVLGLGDLQRTRGTAEQYATFYDPALGSGAGLKAITHPAVGKADYLTPGASGYFDYWGAQAGDPTQGWYSLDLSGWRLLAANTACNEVGGCGGSHPQGLFLRDQLKSSGGDCQLVFDHLPAFTDGPSASTGYGRAIFNVSYANGADLILSGGDTNYQRFDGLRPDGTLDPARGLVPFVVGTGGQPLTDFGGDRRAVARDSGHHGALRLVLSENGWSSQFVTTAGEVLDTATGSCHA